MTAFTGKTYLEDVVVIIEQYRKSVRDDFEAIPESRIWERPVPGQVSAANMLLHLNGNLLHFFGHKLGGSDYQRDRDREFVVEPWIDKAGILEEWETACREIIQVFQAMDGERLPETAPVDQFPGDAPVHRYILRLLTHLTYHAGQIRSLYRIHNPTDA